MPGYQLELETIERLGNMLKAFERGGMAPTLREHLTQQYEDQGVAVRVVQITGSKRSDNTYPAKLLGRNSEAYSGTWSDFEDVSVVEPNNEELSIGTKYIGLCVGWYSGGGATSGGSTGNAAGLWVASNTSSTSTDCPHVSGVICSGGYLAVTYGTKCDSVP